MVATIAGYAAYLTWNAGGEYERYRASDIETRNTEADVLTDVREIGCMLQDLTRLGIKRSRGRIA